MKENVLYPVDYDETKEAPAAKPTAGRDEAVALTLIKAAVPKGGKPLPVETVRKLICGDQPQYTLEAHGVDPTEDLGAALEALLAGRPIIGPAATAGFLPEEVDALALQVIEERKPTWKMAVAEAESPVVGLPATPRDLGDEPKPVEGEEIEPL
jgi:hypothetical protein